MVHSCCVKDCHNKSHDRNGKKVDHNIRFFRFPTWKRGYGQQVEELTKRRRVAWVAAVRRKDVTFNTISPFMRVCSRHFHKGQPAYEMMDTDPDWAPSLHLGHTHVTPTNTARAERRCRRQQLRKEKLQPAKMGVEKDADHGELQDEDGTPEPGVERGLQQAEEEKPNIGEEGGQLHAKEETHEAGGKSDKLIAEDKTHNTSHDVTQTECELCVLRRAEINRLLEENRQLRCELNECRISDGFFGGDDEKVKYYTGLPNLQTFMTLFSFLVPLMHGQRKTLTPFQMLLLTLMRLRLDLPPQHLAHLFHISLKTVYRTFNETVSFIHANLRHLLVFPDREKLQKLMPHEFVEAFGHQVAVIIDCFEILTEKPSNLKVRAQMFSSSKNHHTMKYLIGITPMGAICFLSKGWGGRTSDEHITQNSGFLDDLLPGDIVLADKGFDIQECVGCCQLADRDVEETRQIANLRVHVQRVIPNVCQKYKILAGTVPVNMLLPCEGEEAAMLDKVVTVCCALTNQCPTAV
ncbi:uncharacterized protein LOC125713322 [Brienomyrus brachyistius]|uniref:uncharacterized protein LOC125713322 n=1 Tax=Brienomyrus brachyistius TaxID=42636 RepID=UPI0020B21FB5|nr:uncharacterized protein LOC125713322 [Brienomyrus brachyistius]